MVPPVEVSFSIKLAASATGGLADRPWAENLNTETYIESWFGLD
jgi:hypothetical protein